ncbi:MAG TPA: 3-oxoacyl-ACP reductase family protein [Syntrophorhabdales bacterium]|nr:3-oxoacyl-ACP reductase family protein [Syntrophorhabdales bacterium]
MRLEGKVAIVTGAARGLGRIFSVGLAREGARVLAADKDMEGLGETVLKIREAGSDGDLLQMDVTSREQSDRMAKFAKERFGRIDILINNAALYGGLKRMNFYEIDEKEWDTLMAVNVKGTWLSVRAVFPYMKEQGKGKIVNVASEVFFTGSHGFAHYVASKGAIVGLTRALAVELGPHNICINAIAPGFTDTEGSRTIADVTKYDTSKTPLRRLGMAEDILGAALLFASDEADFITGQTVLVDGGRVMH